jgi:putative hemolysin
MSQLGEIPTTGSSFDWSGLRFEVVDMDSHRVDKVMVSPAGDDAAGAATTNDGGSGA